ncbi:hypothetical protein ACHHYP_17463 [Achlya hypogyna]|uniref:RING-type domain-containing protein n=1 Tax=Achlya hypogyna TaxID=1202772 RepID=A0A1V9Y4D9_ACHHY|nr:hypothetical protein ACHHYP_17463 [Achlya hypogyna]
MEAVQPKLLEELQCIICYDHLYKPISVSCGHSFCRLCLIKSCEAQDDVRLCPICRDPMCMCFEKLNVNVTLWNIVRLLYPNARNEQEEEEAYQLARATYEARQRVRELRGASAEARPADDEDDDDDFAGEAFSDGEDAAEARLHDDENPLQVRVDTVNAEELHITRNVVVDDDAENVDGRRTMRVAFSIVEFPGILETYTEHQECSLAMLQLEEDEELAEGFPAFMAESGDDDNLVVSHHYGEVTLTVFDDRNHIVLERTGRCQAGIVNFQALRLDVPSGMYTFRFYDLATTVFIEIATSVRDSDGGWRPPPMRTLNSSVLEEATERSRHRTNTRREYVSDDEDYSDGNDSDMSFIVSDHFVSDDDDARSPTSHTHREDDPDAGDSDARADVQNAFGLGDEEDEDEEFAVVRPPLRKRPRLCMVDDDDSSSDN